MMRVTERAKRAALVLALTGAAAPVLAGTHVLDVGGGMDVAARGTGLNVGPDPTDPTQRNVRALLGGPPSYGIFFLRYRYNGLLGRNISVGGEFNTDTLSADVTAYDVGLPGITVAAFGRAEALLAGVNNNPIFDGETKADRGFGASYVLAGARTSYTTLGHLSVEAELAGRAWVFNPMPATQPHFRLPTPYASAEPRVRLKWLDAPRGREDLGLPRGLAMVLELGADIRALNEPWGGTTDEEPDPRNSLAQGAVAQRMVAAMVAGGRPLKRLQWYVTGNAGWGTGEDDITRTRVGGQNPYTVNMPGAAWGEFLAARYLAASVHAGVLAKPFLYVGVGLHGAAVDDPARKGDTDDVGVLRGLSTEIRVGFLKYFLLRAQVGGNMDVRRGNRTGALGAFVWVEAGLWI